MFFYQKINKSVHIYKKHVYLNYTHITYKKFLKKNWGREDWLSPVITQLHPLVHMKHIFSPDIRSVSFFFQVRKFVLFFKIELTFMIFVNKQHMHMHIPCKFLKEYQFMLKFISTCIFKLHIPLFFSPNRLQFVGKRNYY